MSIEQRKYPRIATSEETIYFSVDKDEPERIHYMGTITNTSQGGVGMQVSFPHQPEDLLWLEGLEGHSSSQAATVKWIRDAGAESYEIGLQFMVI
jgi:hypothetical protein